MNSNSNQKRIVFGYNRNPANRDVLSGKQTKNQGQLARYIVHDNNPAIL